MKYLKLPLWDFFKSIDDYPRFFDKETYWLYVFITFLCLCAAGLIVLLIYRVVYNYFDKRSSTEEILSGELIDKRYIGEQSSSGTGTAVLPNTSGGMSVGLVSTSSHSDEEFLFFVRVDKIYKTGVDMQQFYKYNIGERIRIKVKTGGLSKEELTTKIIEI